VNKGINKKIEKKKKKKKTNFDLVLFKQVEVIGDETTKIKCDYRFEFNSLSRKTLVHA
jgi:hypothetical protein